MSNIRGLNDLEGGRGGGGAGYGRIPGGGGGGGGGGGPFGGDGPMDEEAQEAAGLFGGLTGGRAQDVEPRKENFWDMWKFAFCPTFTPASFIFVIWVMNTVAYIAALILTALNEDRSLNNLVFLGPDLRVLNSMGCLNPWEIKENY